MRIAVVCSDLGVRVPGDKGASLHLAAVTRALAGVGHDLLLVGVAGHGPPPAGVPAVLLPHPGRANGLRRELRKLVAVERLLALAREPVRRLAPHLVYERLSLFGTAGRRLAEATGALHVVEVNALLAEEEAQWRGLRLGRLARRRERRVLGSAGLRVAVSEQLATQVERVAPGRPTAVVPNGVDAAAFAALPDQGGARARLGLPATAPLLGFVGSLRPWHGVDVAVEALPRLPGAVLVVAGDGPVRASLEDLAADRGVGERVMWLGHVDHPRVPTLLAALDVALVPYPRLDGFAFSPLKLYEYLAAGVPVVASDLGQVSDALEGGRWGTLVPPGDAEALAAGVRAVLADPARARAVAAEARRTALATHGWEQRASLLTELFTRHGAGALAA